MKDMFSTPSRCEKNDREAPEKAPLPDPEHGVAEQIKAWPLCPQSRGTAKKGIIGEGKLPDSRKMALASAVVAGENQPAQRRGQHIKAVVKQLVGFAVDVLHVDLLFAHVVVEPVFGGMRMPV